MEWTAPDFRARAAQAHASTETADAGPSFDEGYALLDEYFGPLGGMDDGDVLRRLIARPWHRGACECRYHLVMVRDDRGELLGAVDCFTVVVDRRIAVGITNNAYVRPRCRGRGVGMLLERAPSEQLRRTVAAVGLPPNTPQLQFSYTYPLSADDEACIGRQTLWSSAGYRVVPFSVAPLFHLEQNDPDDPTGFLPPQPSMVIVRNAHAPYRRRSLWRSELHAFADALDAVDAELIHDDHARIDNIARLRRGIDAHGDDEVALLPMLGESRSLETLAPLLESCAFTGGEPSASDLRWLAEVLARLGSRPQVA